jgi:hypothetical protein
MNIRRTVSRVLLVPVAVVLSATAAAAFSAAAVKSAQELVKQTTERFAVGEVLRADVELAQYYLLDMKYRAGQISARPFARTSSHGSRRSRRRPTTTS